MSQITVNGLLLQVIHHLKQNSHKNLPVFLILTVLLQIVEKNVDPEMTLLTYLRRNCEQFFFYANNTAIQILCLQT